MTSSLQHCYDSSLHQSVNLQLNVSFQVSIWMSRLNPQIGRWSLTS